MLEKMFLHAPPVPTEQTELMEVWFRPFDFNLRILTNSSEVLKAANYVFGPFGSMNAASAADITLQFFEREIDGSLLSKPTYHQEGSLLFQTMGDSATLVADQEAGLAEGHFSSTVLQNQPFFRTHFLELAFFAMLAPRGVMGVHGAAISKNGRAILLRAQSGGGKTTLAYASARTKFQALAEDVVWIDINHKVWWGMPWSFHLLPDARQLFMELAPYRPVIQTNEEMKLEVNLEAVRPGSTTYTAIPGPVVLIERVAGEQSRLEPIGLETARSLWDAGAAGTETSFSDYDQHITRLLQNNAYRLYFGDDIDAAVDLLTTLVR